MRCDTNWKLEELGKHLRTTYFMQLRYYLCEKLIKKEKANKKQRPNLHKRTRPAIIKSASSVVNKITEKQLPLFQKEKYKQVIKQKRYQKYFFLSKKFFLFSIMIEFVPVCKFRAG